MQKVKRTAAATLLLLSALACQKEEMKNQVPIDDSPISATLNRENVQGRTSSGKTYALYSGEYLTAAESGQVGRTIYFNDRGNKQLSADFLPGYSLDGSDNISYYIDGKRPSADLSLAVSSAAINRAMQTWDGVTCSELGMYQVPSSNKITTGFVAELLGFRGSYNFTADVVHAGWLSGTFFDQIAEGGSEFILGVTFTITYTDENGNPTDLNNDGKLDVAWREIYYNDAFTWKDRAHYDVETIALHEAGHGLSQGHFGSAFLDGGSGSLHFAPRAVMNAAYSGIQTQITDTDNAGHCSNWSNW